MIPAGYLLKRISPPPAWMLDGATHIVDVCSVACCVNDDIVELHENWQHNGFGLANSPQQLRQLAEAGSVDTTGAQLFYYEAYEQELESDGWTFDPDQWRDRSPLPSAMIESQVELPATSSMVRLGYDVVVSEDYLEHSPLSCNSMTKQLKANEHCLFDDLVEARAAIDTGAFGEGCEPGRYTIYSVSIINDKHSWR